MWRFFIAIVISFPIFSLDPGSVRACENVFLVGRETSDSPNFSAWLQSHAKELQKIEEFDLVGDWWIFAPAQRFDLRDWLRGKMHAIPAAPARIAAERLDRILKDTLFGGRVVRFSELIAVGRSLGISDIEIALARAAQARQDYSDTFELEKTNGGSDPEAIANDLLFSEMVERMIDDAQEDLQNHRELFDQAMSLQDLRFADLNSKGGFFELTGAPEGLLQKWIRKGFENRDHREAAHLRATGTPLPIDLVAREFTPELRERLISGRALPTETMMVRLARHFRAGIYEPFLILAFMAAYNLPY